MKKRNRILLSLGSSCFFLHDNSLFFAQQERVPFALESRHTFDLCSSFTVDPHFLTHYFFCCPTYFDLQQEPLSSTILIAIIYTSTLPQRVERAALLRSYNDPTQSFFLEGILSILLQQLGGIMKVARRPPTPGLCPARSLFAQRTIVPLPLIAKSKTQGATMNYSGCW